MSVTIERRFRGPATSGNGGYVSGLLADALTAAGPPTPDGDAVRVRLSNPPPLDQPLQVELDPIDGSATLRDGGTTIGVATWATLELEPVSAVTPAEAAATAAAYVDGPSHPFKGCFVCGPGREPGDGLRLFAGQHAPGRTACVWQPDASVAAPDGTIGARMVWCALDCPGGWTWDMVARPMVLGTMTTRIGRLPRLDEPCVVTGRLDRTDNRRTWTSSALYGADGDLLAAAEAIWIHIDPETFDRVFAVHE